jgi:hypothetical protein
MNILRKRLEAWAMQQEYYRSNNYDTHSAYDMLEKLWPVIEAAVAVSKSEEIVRTFPDLDKLDKAIAQLEMELE